MSVSKGLPKKYAKLGFKKGWAAYKASNRKPKAKKSTVAKKHRKKKTNKPMQKSEVTKLVSIIKKGGSSMAKKSRSTKRRFSGIKSKVRNYVKNISPEDSLKGAAVAIGGAVAGSMVASKLPLQGKMKAIAPVAVGLLLQTKIAKGNKMLHNAGIGLMVMGGLSLIRQFAPQIPLLAGEDDLSGVECVNSPEVAGIEDMSGYDGVEFEQGEYEEV